ncbi:UNVERIFIED_CONTAM: hypothetical protein K2H54_059131, partial [Gekko kuhli]
MPGASVPPPSPPPPHSRGDSASSVAGSTAPRKPDKKTKSPQESVAHKAKDKKKPEKSSKISSDTTSGPPEPKRPRKSAPATTPTLTSASAPTSASVPTRPSDPECTPTDDSRYRRSDRAASDDRRSDVMLVPSRSPSVCSQPPSEIFESDDGRAPAPRDRPEWFQDVEPVMPYYGPRTRIQRPLSQSATHHYFMEYSPEPRSPSPNTYARHYYASRYLPYPKPRSPLRYRDPRDRDTARDRGTARNRDAAPPPPRVPRTPPRAPPSASLGAPPILHHGPSEPIEPPLYMPEDLTRGDESSPESVDHPSNRSDSEKDDTEPSPLDSDL